MSKLHFFGRPWVAFDASNREHREWYSEYVKSGTWGRCPYRFIIPDDHGNLITMIQRALVQWYTENEFCKPKK